MITEAASQDFLISCISGASKPQIMRHMEEYYDCGEEEIKEFDREELEEAFVEMLYNKAVERQTFINIMKDHGIDAEITLTFLNANQVP